MIRVEVLNPIKLPRCTEEVNSFRDGIRSCKRRAIYRIEGTPYCLVHAQAVALNLLVRENAGSPVNE